MIDVCVQMESITCCAKGCGIGFAVPAWWRQKRREDHSVFFCPNGHPQCFATETDAEKYRRLYLQENQRSEQTAAELRDTKAGLERTKKTLDRTKKRVGNGVCPCCHRHFTNVQRHMHTKHPEYAEK